MRELCPTCGALPYDQTQAPSAREYKNELVNSGQRIGELVKQVNVLSAQRDELLAALKLLVPADFDEHPRDFAPEWHAARAVIRKIGDRTP